MPIPLTPFPEGRGNKGDEVTAVRFRIGKSDKARRILGWEPKCDLDYIIEDTLGFIKQWAEQRK